jgi:hypothetical protein
MLQRKQTIWMLLAIICAALTFKFPFFSGNVQVGANGHVLLGVTAAPTIGFGRDSASSGSVLILVVTIILMVGALYDIFIYKTRSKQLWIAIGLIFLSLLNIFLYWRASQVPTHFMEGNYSLGALFPIVIPVFLVLAVQGIMKDQKLVKSADRLR